jgi:hypothetical protein
MYVSANGPVRLANDIVTAVRVDEEGQLWFLTNSPSQLLEECEQTFPARLRFYRKGIDFFMEVSGKATIISNASCAAFLNEEDLVKYNSKKILVKMGMLNIEYAEPYIKKQKNKIELVLGSWYNWFLHTVSVRHDAGSVLKKLRQTN